MRFKATNNTERDTTLGDLILKEIELYKIQDAAERFYFLKHKKNIVYSGPQPIDKLREALNKRNKEVDVNWFIELLLRVMTCGTFYNLHEAEELEKSFDGYKIDPPIFITKCFEEVKIRTKLIEKWIDKKEHNWNVKQVNQYKDEINSEINVYTFDNDSRAIFLKKKFQAVVDDLAKTEHDTLNDYGHNIANLYTNEVFANDKEQLNWFFYTGESKHHTINVLFDLAKFVRDYIDNRNKLKVLKEYLNHSNTSLEPRKSYNPLLRTDLILKIYQAFNDVLFKDITESDFLNCFDLNNIPNKYPTYINQNGFAVVLNELTEEQGAQVNINPKVALSHFNIKNYTQVKNKLSQSAHYKTKNKIRAILSPPKAVLK